MWTDEREGTSQHAERRRDDARSRRRWPAYAQKRAACIEALKIVQRHRGWVSDEALDDVAALLGHDARRAGRRRHLLQPDLPQAGRAARDPDLRQRQLLGHGLRDAASSTCKARLGIGLGETTADGRFTLLPIRLPGRLRPRAGDDDRRRPARRSDAGEDRRRSSADTSRGTAWLERPLTENIRPGEEPLEPRRNTRRPAATRRCARR